MSYTTLKLKNDISASTTKSINDTKLFNIINNAVDEVFGEVDFASTKRRAYITSGLFSDIKSYPAPSDMKKIIDVYNVNETRYPNDYWRLTTPEEFSRYCSANGYNDYDYDYYNYSGSFEKLLSIDNTDKITKILLSRPVSGTLVTIDSMDDITGWTGFGDGENLLTDTQNYIKGSGSINFDINSDGGTTAGIEKSTIGTMDITNYVEFGSIFACADINDITDITNYKLRLGSDSSNYYEITVTTTNEGTAFQDGWNLLRFDLKNKSENGSVDDTAITYAAIFMTKAVGKTNETDYRFDNLLIGQSVASEVIYYSSYPWITSAGVRIQDSTADTDVLQVDREEYQLVLEKSRQIAEQYLTEDTRSAMAEKRYKEKLASYIIGNISEALIKINTLFNF